MRLCCVPHSPGPGQICAIVLGGARYTESGNFRSSIASLYSLYRMLSNPSTPQIETSTTKAQPPLFSGLGEWVESHPVICLSVFLAVFVCAELGYSLRMPLWHDEIFTSCIAQAPSLASLLHLTQTIDLNPPLSYLLTRLSFHLFGVGTLQTRLPEILGFGLALICVFLFVRRRAGSAYGLLAAAILFSSKAVEPAIDGRPYGLVFGFGALALVAWQSSSICQQRGISTLASDLVLCLSLGALLLSHVLSLLVWGAVVLAEAAQIRATRRVVASRVLALVLPLAATAFYIPLFDLHATASFPPGFQAHYSEIFDYYASRTSRELISISCAVALIAIIAGRQWLRPAAQYAFTRSEWVAVCVILLSPVALIWRLAYQHAAFFYRYADFAAMGFAILISGLLCRLTANRPTPAVLAAIAFLIASSRWQHAVMFVAEGHILRHSEPTIAYIDTQVSDTMDLPLVVNSGVDFLEMCYHEPARLLGRTYYLTAPQISLQYTNANIFGGIPTELREFQLGGHSEPYAAFILRQRHFYLVADNRDHDEDWLLRKLPSDGAHLRLVRLVENSYSYHDRNLYEVTFAETALTHSNTPSAPGAPPLTTER